jgi:hypothetical protein
VGVLQTNNITELDIALRRFTFHIQNATGTNACLAFQQLALVSLGMIFRI